MKVAYCAGFWSTNIGNGFFGMGVQHVLCEIFGKENVTVVSDYQTYTNAVGMRHYPHKKQLEFISQLDVDLVVLAGPVLSRYFLPLWQDVLLTLQSRGVRYMLLSAGAMKLNEQSRCELKAFFEQCPPFAISSRDTAFYHEFGQYARHAYDGICFSFFVPEAYAPAGLSAMGPYVVCNFDKMGEPQIVKKACCSGEKYCLSFDGEDYHLVFPRWMTALSSRTDRFTDALIYVLSLLPAPVRKNQMGQYRIIRTDHRFHPHFRRKIYRQKDSFVADLPYGYLNLYANAALTLSDRVHACAATLAFGNSAMLFAKTERDGLLERVGAGDVCMRPVKLDQEKLQQEKSAQVNWLRELFREEL